jgi:nucleotide-binding universal stress UspA family protein
VKVVVGVDGSPGSDAALLWAADEASRRDESLLVVHAWTLPVVDATPFGAPTVDLTLIEDSARKVLSDALDAARAAVPDLQVEGRTVRRSPATALLDAVGSDDLLVVGSRGRGGFAGLLLGSVSSQVAHHAHCPVVVVPAPGPR